MSMTIEDIKRISAETVGVTVDDIDGRLRTQKVSLARSIAIYFSRKKFGSKSVVSHFNRLNCNVIHTCNRVKGFLECDPEYREIIKKVEAKLG